MSRKRVERFNAKNPNPPRLQVAMHTNNSSLQSNHQRQACASEHRIDAVACRLVIDTGLHTKGWTRQQAMDPLAENTALSLHNVQTEVDRFISWPGQALAYKMGELTIWELRPEAEKALGDRFDIRTFHDAVLTGGGLPLELLREQIQLYVERERAE